MKVENRGGDRWLDEIAFRDHKGSALPTSFAEWKGRELAPDDESMYFYGRKVPATVIAIAIMSKTSPKTIMKLTERLEPIKRRLLKE